MVLDQLDAEKVRPAVEYFTRVVNDFSFTKMFFVKNCSLLLRDISDNHRMRVPANESIRSERPWLTSASSQIDSVMSFETEELVHFRGRDPVSAYPLIRLTLTSSCTRTPMDFVSYTNALETLPESSKSLEFLLKSLAWVVCLFRIVYLRDISRDVAKFQTIMQVEIYDLTSSERVKRGVKRAWLIGETLALETGSGQKQPNIQRTKYRGVRFRPSRSRTKPWTAEVKPQMEKNKVWIDDCNTPEAAAHAFDVAAFYYGKGNKALNFENTPRFLPKILEYSCEKEKRRAIQEQARHLRRDPLFYFTHQLPYGILFMYVVYEFLFAEPRESAIQLAFLVVELMRLVRNDDVATIFRASKWRDATWGSLRNVHVPTKIPQLLECIDCIIKEFLPQAQQHYKFPPHLEFLNFFGLCSLHFTAPFPTKDISFTRTFIEWVRINIVTPQTTSMEAKHLPASLPQCNVLSIRSVEIDLRAPQTSSMALEAEDPLVNIPPQCNTLSMHDPHEQIQDTLEQDLIISHKFSLESQHSTYQDATPEEQVVQSSIGNSYESQCNL